MCIHNLCFEPKLEKIVIYSAVKVEVIIYVTIMGLIRLYCLNFITVLLVVS